MAWTVGREGKGERQGSSSSRAGQHCTGGGEQGGDGTPASMRTCAVLGGRAAVANGLALPSRCVRATWRVSGHHLYCT